MPISRLIVALVLVALVAGMGVAWAKHRKAAEAEQQAGLADVTLLVIRHAEKPARGDDRGLSKAGEARAQAYVGYFRHFELDGRPVHLDALIASADSKASARPRLTLEPLAKATGLAVQTPFANKQVKDAARWIGSGQIRGTALVAWHHGRLAALIARLGADPASLLPGADWPDDVYDWVVVLRYDGAGRLTQSLRIVEPADLASH